MRMKQEHSEKLYKDFPILFGDRNKPMTETCMCWGFDVGDGWYDLIYECSKKLSNLDIIPVASQVKEKFGTLRFYISGGTDEAYDIIDEAEEKSEKTCETCGEPGKLIGSGWYYTACVKHTKENDLEEKENEN